MRTARRAVLALLIASALAHAGLAAARAAGLSPGFLIEILVPAAVAVAAVWAAVAIRRERVRTRTLEEEVDVRTQQLGALVRDLDRARAQQERFVANATHELRTPLTVMSVAARTLLRAEFGLEGNARDLAQMADRHAERMRRLVEDLLICAGMSDSALPERKRLDVAAEVQTVLDSFELRDHRVARLLRPGLDALGDAGHLRLILIHLLDNAAKFSPAGSTISVEVSAGPGCIDVAIGDEGPGVPDEYRDRIFDRFVQVDGSATRPHGGVGLGLHIARSMARSMGAEVTVSDHPAGGSVFRVSIPAAFSRETAQVTDGPGPELDLSEPARSPAL